MPHDAMLFLHVIFAVLATHRLTELLTVDKITEKGRNFLFREFPNFYLLSCLRCVSIWAGFIATALFFVNPYLNWPFAFGFIYLAMKDSEMLKKRRNFRQFVVELDANNNMNVPRQDLTPEELGKVHLVVAGLQRAEAQK
jgi:hypothetical protein